MAIFEDVTLTWKGDEFVIPANQLMRLIAKIEDEITIQELTASTGVKLSKLALAYTVALQYAGAKVTNEEVYESLFSNQSMTATFVTSLLMLMIPPTTYKPRVKTKAKTETSSASD